MKKIYLVFHEYGRENGWGIYLSDEEIVAAFDSEEKANEFVALHNNPHKCVGTPDEYECGELVVRRFYMSDTVEDASKGLGFYAKGLWYISREDICGPLFKNLPESEVES